MRLLATRNLAIAAQSVFLHSGVSVHRARQLRRRVVLMLHGVGGADLPERDFVAAMRWLARHFEIVSLPTMLANIRHGRPPAARGEVALTFDDGLRNNVDVAYPVLRDLGMPATFFVCPGLIDDAGWIWTHEVRARLARLCEDEQASLRAALGAPAPSIDAMVEWMKTLGPAAREAAEASVRDATPRFVPTPAERRAYDLAGWDALRGLDPGLVTLGSHTMRHPILPTLDAAAIRAELVKSRRRLEQATGREAALMCYPNGSLDARVRALAAETYGAALTCGERHVDHGVDLLAIPRIPVAARLSLLAWRLHRPQA